MNQMEDQAYTAYMGNSQMRSRLPSGAIRMANMQARPNPYAQAMQPRPSAQGAPMQQMQGQQGNLGQQYMDFANQRIGSMRGQGAAQFAPMLQGYLQRAQPQIMQMAQRGNAGQGTQPQWSGLRGDPRTRQMFAQFQQRQQMGQPALMGQENAYGQQAAQMGQMRPSTYGQLNAQASYGGGMLGGQMPAGARQNFDSRQAAQMGGY